MTSRLTPLDDLLDLFRIDPMRETFPIFPLY